MDEEKQKKSVVIDSTNIFGLKKSKLAEIEKPIEKSIKSSVDHFNFANPLAPPPVQISMASAAFQQEPINQVTPQATPISFDSPAEQVFEDQAPVAAATLTSVHIDMPAELDPANHFQMPAGEFTEKPFFELPADPVSSAAFNFSVDQINSEGFSEVAQVSQISQAPSFSEPYSAPQEFNPPPPPPAPPIMPIDPMSMPANAHQDPRALAEMAISQLHSIESELQIELSEIQSLRSNVFDALNNSERRLSELLGFIGTQKVMLNNIREGRMN